MQTHGSRVSSNTLNNSGSSSNNNNNISNSNSNSSSLINSNNNNNNNNNINSNTPNNKSKKGSNATTATNSVKLSSANKDNRRELAGDDGNLSPSVMSKVLFSPIDDDHIDDQETMKVGKLIIDFECELEKEKIENEQLSNISASKTSNNNNSCTTITTSTNSNNAPSSFASSFETKSVTNNGCPSTSSSTSGKSNQKSSGKLSVSSSTSSTNNGGTNNNNNNNSATNNGNNNGHPVNTRSVFKTSADERGELKMRITRETKPGKSEHKIVTSPSNQKSPTSCSGNNMNDNLHSEESNSHEANSKPTQSSSSISSKKECGTSTSIGTITEPDCLGPCEPGTSVTLEGIVWQETEGGILVVNVTWRGKTYVGALLDCTKHDWAPPRLCDSPASDIDSKAHKGVRTKRIVTRSNGIGLDEKNLLQTTGKLRNGKGRRILTPNDQASCNKRQRDSDKPIENIAAQVEAKGLPANVSSMTDSDNACVSTNMDTATNNESISTTDTLTEKTGPNSPIMISCSESNCSKKFRNMNGLLYHQAHAHSNDSESNILNDNNFSLSSKENKINKSPMKNNEMNLEEKESFPEESDRQSPKREDSKQEMEVDQFQDAQIRKRSPSPQVTYAKINSFSNDPANMNINFNSHIGGAPLNQNTRSSNNNVSRHIDPDRRNSSSSSHVSQPNMDHMNSRRSPSMSGNLGSKSHSENLPGPNNHSQSGQKLNVPKQSNNGPPLPPLATSEEGMKPSGTSTGPPPAPHQGNCFFNPPFVTGGPYGGPYGLAPYMPRAPPMSMFDLQRLMNHMRGPPLPESPSRLLSPSMSKNLPPLYPTGPLPVPVPTSQMTNAPLPNMPPMTNPPSMTGGSPHLRLPSQLDHLMPPNPQAPPFPPPPAGMNPALGPPGGPMGLLGPPGPPPPLPGLLDDMAKQFPRRFN